jgi:hypothetical protein
VLELKLLQELSALLKRNRPNEIANVHAGVCEKEIGGFKEFATPAFQNQKQWWSKDQIRNAQVIVRHSATLEQILLDKVGAGFYFDFYFGCRGCRILCITVDQL